MASYIVVSDVSKGYEKGATILPRPEGYTRFSLTSDTHSFPLPAIPADTDIFIHSGDLTEGGDSDEIQAAVDQIGSLPRDVIKIFIAGNHDLMLDAVWMQSYSALGSKHTIKLKEYIKEKSDAAGNMYYLENESLEVTVPSGKTWKIFGTPYSAEFYNWAFMSDKYPVPKIPPSTEVLISHGPPFEILDLATLFGLARGGCRKLLEAVKAAKPRMHVFGHIHEARGTEDDGSTLFVNAAALEGAMGRGRIRGVIVVDLKDNVDTPVET